jgi:hypothetical protein
MGWGMKKNYINLVTIYRFHNELGYVSKVNGHGLHSRQEQGPLPLAAMSTPALKHIEQPPPTR